MTMRDELQTGAFDNSGGPALLPPPVNPHKSVLRSIAALDAAEAGARQGEPSPAASRSSASRSAPVIEGVANTPAPEPANAQAGEQRPVAKPPAEPIKPLRASAFRSNTQAEPARSKKSSPWLSRAAAAAILMGGGWLISANVSTSNLPFFGGSAEMTARLSTIDQLRQDLQQVSGDLQTARAQLAQLDSPEVRARQNAELEAIKKSMGDLSRRIEQGRTANGVAVTEVNVRVDRDAKLREELAERVARLERQVSDGKPVAAISQTPPANSTVVSRSVAMPPPPAADANALPKPTPLAGYALREVQQGVALLESKRGFLEVYPGSMIPGAGRVQSIVRRQGGWVVVTSAGVIGPKFD